MPARPKSVTSILLMRPKVTAVVVARDAASALERTIPALESQTAPIATSVFVHIDSRDDTLEIMRAAQPTLLLTVAQDSSFGKAVATAVSELDKIEPIREADTGAAHPDEWLWLINAGDTPEPNALAELLDTAERNPSLAVTGPKLVSAQDPSRLVEYGQSIVPTGESIRLRTDALDQGQYESFSDVLAVATNGMLVRRDVWNDLQGFDPGLEAVDDSLDFCVRTWLAGNRVLLTPDARVETLGRDAPGTAKYGRRTGAQARHRLRRTATLHRRLAWSGPLMFWVYWLLLLPEVLVLTVLNLLRKQPGRILPELFAALKVFFGGTRALSARRQFAATSTQPLSSLDRLRISAPEWRTMRAIKRDEQLALAQQGGDRYNFITGGGGWVALITAVASVIMLFPLLRSSVLSGGALLPLSGSIGELWAATGYGLRDTGGGIGVADPFQFVLAALGSLTFWQPSLIVVIIWLIALPLAATGAWFIAARFTRRPWLRAFFALAWACSPTLLGALADGRLPAVLVHITLPWFAFAFFAARYRWAASAVASLLGVVIAASAPSLIPALILLWLLMVTTSGTGWLRQMFVPIPAAAMFLPLLVTQLNRGRPLAIFADPALPQPYDPLHGWNTVFGFADTGLGGWPEFLQQLGLTDIDPFLLFAVLLAPLALLAAIGIFANGWRLALAGLIIAATGWITAGVAGGLSFAVWEATAAPIYPAAAQSLGYFGLLMAAIAGAAYIGPLRVPVTMLALAGVTALIVPLFPAHITGSAAVAASDGRTLPAIASVQGEDADQLGTLRVTPMGPDQLRLSLERGSGMKLNEISTLATTNPATSKTDEALAELVVDFLSIGKSNPMSQLHELGIGFVLIQPAEGAGAPLGQRLVTGLSTNESVTSIGKIKGYGTLFQVVNAAERPTDPVLAQQLEVTNWQNVLGRAMLIVQTVILLFVILLALPTGRIADLSAAARRTKPQWEDLDRGSDVLTLRNYRLDNERVEVYSSAASGEAVGPAGKEELGD